MRVDREQFHALRRLRSALQARSGVRGRRVPLHTEYVQKHKKYWEKVMVYDFVNQTK